jgi:hypothetical protein
VVGLIEEVAKKEGVDPPSTLAAAMGWSRPLWSLRPGYGSAICRLVLREPAMAIEVALDIALGNQTAGLVDSNQKPGSKFCFDLLFS